MPKIILHVEDSDDDAELMTLALDQAIADWRHEIDLVRAKNFGDAINLVRAKMPHLVLLDLNLPGRSGMELLKELKSLRLFRHIPVIVLSNSQSESDVLTAYKRQAAAYCTKPARISHLVQLIERFDAFWLKSAVLPA